MSPSDSEDDPTRQPLLIPTNTPAEREQNSTSLGQGERQDLEDQLAALQVRIRILEAAGSSSSDGGPIYLGHLEEPRARERKREQQEDRRRQIPEQRQEYYQSNPMGQTFGGRPAEQLFSKQNTPSLKQLQLTIKPFTGEEIYPGLGSRFF